MVYAPFTIDFSDEGKHSPTTLLIFGNPKAGTPLMQNQKRIGVDLPQKFLVWEDGSGQVHITYNDIFFIFRQAQDDAEQTQCVEASSFDKLRILHKESWYNFRRRQDSFPA